MRIMRSKIAISVMLFLFISCSNLKELSYRERPNNQILLEQKREQEIELKKLVEKLKYDLKSNDFDDLDNLFSNSFTNRKILAEIRKIDFSKIQIMSTELKFHRNNATNIIAFIFMDEVRYFQVRYKLKNGAWKITKIKDGR